MDVKKDLWELLVRRGFLVQSSELYGGLAGFYDYGVHGAPMKRKFEDLWRRYFLTLGHNFYEISGAEIMPEDVFRASGHLEHFDDPVVMCKKCSTSERADHVLAAHLKEKFEGLSESEYDALITKHKIKCHNCGGPLGNAAKLNLMFPIQVGVSTKTRAFLRPETAQVPYVNFARTFEVTRKKLPLGLAVIGRAFRNEISPRQGVYRMREFTQAELQIFFDPSTLDEHEDWDSVKTYKLRLLFAKNRDKIQEVTCAQAHEKGLPKFYAYHLAKMQQFYLEVLGVPKDRFRFYELSPEERAFYNKAHWDAEVDMESIGGWSEVGAVHYRTDHDLSGHARVSKKPQEVFYNEKRFVPHVLEMTVGVDRNVYMLLELGLKERDGKTILSVPRQVAPFDAAIFPLVNKEGMDALAWTLYKELAKQFNVYYDDSGSIGRRYARQDEIGTAFCITIDGDTIKDGTVTVRDRDSGEQDRVKKDKLAEKLRSALS